MPSTPDHKVEMFRLAQSRLHAGLPSWNKKINLAGVFHNNEMTFGQRRDAIVARLRESPWLTSCSEDDELIQYVDELAHAQDAGDFNAAWDAIYDCADYDRVWIRTV